MDAIKMKKIPREEAARLDKAQREVCLLHPPEADVEGQLLEYRQAECPWCKMVSYVLWDTAGFHWYTCCYCGNSFRG
jgi:hypothetical protein